MSNRLFFTFVALLLGFMAWLAIGSALAESATFDEGIHLASGYSYWRTGDYRLNPEHPPLQKLWSALPLLWQNPRLPLEHPSWRDGDGFEFGYRFLYDNVIPAPAMLNAARMMTVLVALALGVAVALKARALVGAGGSEAAAAALLALALYALDPNFLAHGHYITTDVAAALFFFLACVTWCGWLERPGRLRLAAAGLCLGLALASKFSTVLLFPLLGVLALLKRPPLRRLAAGCVLAGLLALAVVAAAYGPETVRAFTQPGPRLHEVVDTGTSVGSLFHWVGRKTGLPAYPFFRGIADVAHHNQEGHATYLLGSISSKGTWRYFPVAFAVKTPTALLLLLPLALWVVVRRRSFAWFALLLPALAFFAFSMTSGINIGLRHLLPVYPFLYVLAAAAVFHSLPRKAALAVAAVALAVQAGETAQVHPHHLSFFNTLSGGPERGDRYLVDSNIDWGQDLLHLKQFLAENKIEYVCLAYFGRVDPAYYGIWHDALPTGHDPPAKFTAMNCRYAVVSLTLLNDVYLEPGAFAWLRKRKPVASVGYSMRVFEVSGPKP